MAELYLHSPIFLHGMMLNILDPEITLYLHKRGKCTIELIYAIKLFDMSLDLGTVAS
jgi:hypothetical protein